MQALFIEPFFSVSKVYMEHSCKKIVCLGVNATVPPRRFDSGNTCPVCLNEVQFAVETNCGHVFCGKFVISDNT